jgi:LacI family transcriptional regulator
MMTQGNNAGREERAKRTRQLGRRKTGAATLSDVARCADISIASVSRVLSGRSPVSLELRERVWTAIKEVGYRPTRGIGVPLAQRSRIVGALVPTLENQTFARFLVSFQGRLGQSGYNLLLATTQYEPKTELVETEALLSRGVEAMVVVGGDHLPELPAMLNASNRPFVTAFVIDKELPSVGFDNRVAAQQLTEYLLSLGHLRFGVIAGLTRSNDRARQRVEGIRLALAASNLSLSEEGLIERPYKIQDGQVGFRALMDRKDRPTAVICGNDILAFGAISEAARLGLRVPEDVSIAGIDDSEFAAHLIPPLTTVRVPVDEMGERAAEYLLGRLRGDTMPRVTELAVNLIVRKTTAPPPK